MKGGCELNASDVDSAMATLGRSDGYRIAQNFDWGKFCRILTLQIFDRKYFDVWSLSFTLHL